MKFCHECGHERKLEDIFCSNCGASFNQDSGQINQAETIDKNVVVSKETNETLSRMKHQMKRRNIKIITGLLLLLIVCGSFFGYQYGKSIFSEENVVESFLSALEEENISALKEMIVPKDSRIEVTDQSLENLFAMLKENPSLHLELETSLLKGEDALFKLRKEGKMYFLFDHFVVDVSGQYLTINSTGEGVSVLIGDEEVGVLKGSDINKKFGPLLPGMYKVRGERETEFAYIEDEHMIMLDGSVDHLEVDLDTGGHYIKLDSNRTDARLYVNGKDTGLYIGDYLEFGPVDLDGSTIIWAQKDEPTEVVRSKSHTIYKEGRIHLYFDESVEAVTEEKTSETTHHHTTTYIIPSYVNEGSYYILPHSHTQRLTEADLYGFSSSELRLARNEIFARHGYIFESDDLNYYFSALPWYVPNPHYNGTLSSTEEHNVELIKSRE